MMNPATNNSTPSNSTEAARSDRIGRPERKDWAKTRKTLHFFRGLSAPKRLGIWVRGYIDGKRGHVSVSADGLVTSPYCSQMLQDANKRVDAEWLNCDGDVNELRPFLDQRALEYDGLVNELVGLDPLRMAEAQQAEALVFEGDKHISDATVSRRRAARVAKATEPIESRKAMLVERLNAIQAEAAGPLADYEEREAIAASHELVISHELAEKTAVYVRGASRHLGTNAGEVRSLEPTRVPQTNHYQRYRRYDFTRHLAADGA